MIYLFSQRHHRKNCSLLTFWPTFTDFIIKEDTRNYECIHLDWKLINIIFYKSSISRAPPNAATKNLIKYVLFFPPASNVRSNLRAGRAGWRGYFICPKSEDELIWWLFNFRFVTETWICENVVQPQPPAASPLMTGRIQEKDAGSHKGSATQKSKSMMIYLLKLCLGSWWKLIDND